jgi:ADP-ribose pyrophosphatase YjhB (NUDIX family)
MQRMIRYQGAIIQDDHILLIQHRHHADGHSYWLLPGGGLEGEETPETCVQREVREETHLHVVMHPQN